MDAAYGESIPSIGLFTTPLMRHRCDESIALATIKKNFLAVTVSTEKVSWFWSTV
jgi:hypothetical protein